MNIKGEVILKKINIGSKSEHEAVMLRTENSDVRLRIPGGSPSREPKLEQYVGKKVMCKGDFITTVTTNISYFMCTEIKEDGTNN